MLPRNLAIPNFGIDLPCHSPQQIGRGIHKKPEVAFWTPHNFLPRVCKPPHHPPLHIWKAIVKVLHCRIYRTLPTRRIIQETLVFCSPLPSPVFWTDMSCTHHRINSGHAHQHRDTDTWMPEGQIRHEHSDVRCAHARMHFLPTMASATTVAQTERNPNGKQITNAHTSRCTRHPPKRRTGCPKPTRTRTNTRTRT